MPLKNKVTKTRCSLILLLGGNQGSEELFTAAPPDGRRLDRQSHHPPPEKKERGEIPSNPDFKSISLLAAPKGGKEEERGGG